MGKDFMKSLLVSYFVTFVLLAVFAVLLYKCKLTEKEAEAGILWILFLGSFAGGYVIGRIRKKAGILWGMGNGSLYFLLLVLVALGIYHGISETGIHLMMRYFICAGGGMAGGGISMKKCFPKKGNCAII